jgi:two-component system, LytTR family, sensor kinase
VYSGPLQLSLAWVFVGTLAYARHRFHDPSNASFAEYLLWQTCFVPWIALTPIVFRAERRFSPAKLALFGIPVSAAAWGISVLAGCGWHPVDLSVAGVARGVAFQQFFYWSTVGAGWVLRALTEKSQLEASLRQAELDALRMRLDPHFLFNSLQNISVLTQQDPRTASRMLTRLGDLLRVSLRKDGKAETTLAAEIDLTRSYLSIEQMRFGDKLSTVVNLEPGSEQALVPTFLLQPLVENAIRHGLNGVRRDGVIAISGRVIGSELEVTVADNGVGIPSEPVPLGIGLGATRERLDRMYPRRHSFAMRSLPEGGTEVCIRLPLRLEPAKEKQSHAHAAAAHRG